MSESRALLLLRAVAGIVALVFLTLIAWFSIAVALVPVAWRRTPLGVRLRPMGVRQARIIPFQRSREKALPR